MQLQESSFKTYNGYCHVLLDKLILSDSENPNAEVEEKDNYTVRTIINSITVSILIAGAITGFFKNEIYWALLCLVFAGYFLYKVILINSYSSAAIIFRSSIQKIEFKPAIYDVQRAHFIVYYLSKNQKTKKRVIVLTGNFDDNKNPLVKQALEVIEAEFG